MIVRRAFSLIESIVVVMVLGISVPPMLLLMGDAASDRVDSVSTTRATTLAAAVLEQVIADVHSSAAGLGFSALDDPATYLNTSGTGLRDRLTGVTSVYESLGITYSVGVGPLVDQTGAVSGDSSLDVFRVVTVTVDFPSARVGTLSLAVSTMVADL